MAATNYTYSIANDFPATGLASDRLAKEIRDSSIVTALDKITTSDDVCNIWFKDALSAADKTTLDGDTTSPAGGLIAAHSGEPLPTAVAPVILEPTGDSAKNLQALGVEFEAELNTDTSKSVQFSENRDVQGVNVQIANHQPGPNGDSMRVAIEAPDGQGGWVEVRVLARGEEEDSGCPVPSNGSVVVVSEGTATIPPALRITATYTCVKTTGDKPLVHMIFRTWL